MERFDEQAAQFERLLQEDAVEDAVGLCLAACAHYWENNEKPEPPNLRDARADLMARCTFVLPLEHASFPVLQSLLQRRVFNWLNEGDEEVVLFPSLLVGGYDAGYDCSAPKPLEEYIHALASRGDDEDASGRLTWLHQRSKQVIEEMHRRLHDVHAGEPFRVGARIAAHGLIKEKYNGQKGTLTCKRGSRWAVLFDNKSDTPKALKPSNLTPLILTSLRCDQCSNEPTAVEFVLASLICTAQGMACEGPQPAEIQTRMEWAWRSLRVGCVVAPRCSADPCLGIGYVDIADFASGYAPVRHNLIDCAVADTAGKCRRYLLSGLCAKCQM